MGRELHKNEEHNFNPTMCHRLTAFNYRTYTGGKKHRVAVPFVSGVVAICYIVADPAVWNAPGLVRARVGVCRVTLLYIYSHSG